MRRGVLVLFCSIFLILVSLTYPLIKFDITADSKVQTFHDGTDEKIVSVPDFDTSFYIEVPTTADALEATMNVSFVDFDGLYPINPILRMGTSIDPVWMKPLWEYKNTGYGALGHQYSFTSGAIEDELVYDEATKEDEVTIFLPASAHVRSAKINLTGIEYDCWSKDVLELNVEPDGTGDYEPDMTVFNDQLFTVYRSYNDVVTNASDADIVITNSTDGFNWSSGYEITSRPDSIPPYNYSLTSADWRPVLEQFKNRLYCAWESNGTSTSGPDHDILLRSSANGITWSEPIVNVSDLWEDTYSVNPGIKNDWTADMAVFKNKLWLVWVSNNTGSNSGFSTSIGDIMITNSSDGITWGVPKDLVKGDNWYTNDLSPKLTVFNNSLYAVWVSNTTKLAHNDELDFDIVYRNTTDGVNWSALKTLNPNDNDYLFGKGSVDHQPMLLSHDNKLYCAWMSAATQYTSGVDFDIVLGYTSNGTFDSENITHMEVSDEKNNYYEHSPQLTVFEDRLYIIWVSEVAGNTGNSEILVRYLDLDLDLNPANNHLSMIQQVNPPDNGGKDYWPKVSVFKNKLFATWVSNDTKTGTGKDKDIILTHLTTSHLPLKIGLDVGGDGTWDIAKATQLDEQITEFDLTSYFNNVLTNNTWQDNNSKTTSYGFTMSEIPLNVQFSGPGKILAQDLHIYYNCTFQVKDFSKKLNEYITSHPGEATSNNTIKIPFTLTVPVSTKGKIKVSDVSVIFDHKPSINIIEPPEDGLTISEPVFRIQWSDFDPDDNAKISLYYDTDAHGFDGKVIATNLSEDGDLDENYFDWAWWNTEELRAGGTYHIYANITDGRNYYLNYSEGPLKIPLINITNFIDLQLVEPDGVDDDAWDAVVIQWASYNYWPDQTANIALYYDTDDNGFDGLPIDINNDSKVDDQDLINMTGEHGQGTIIWNISGLPQGSSVFIYGKITDHWNISYSNYSSGPITRLHMPAPKGFVLVDDLDPLDNNFTTHDQNPSFTWLPPMANPPDDMEYVFKVCEGSDNSGEKVFEDTVLTTEVSVDKPLEFHQIYYAEVFAQLADGNASMKAGLTFELTNHAPEAPVIAITPGSPKTTSILNCTVLNESFDHENDRIEYSYLWFKNGHAQVDYTNLTEITSDATTKGERWRCTVLPNDGIDQGIGGSIEVLIGNSPPTIKIDVPVSGKEYQDNEVINIKFTIHDPDAGDIEHIQYIVYANELKHKIRTGYVDSNNGIVEFATYLAEGTHNLTFNISDGETSIEVYLEVKVSGHQTEDLNNLMLQLIYGIVIIVVILLIFFLALLTRVRNMKKEDKAEDKAEVDEEE